MDKEGKFIQWLDHQIKIRELHLKEALEYQRIAAEFSKLIVTNLFLLNAGGLVALPATANYAAGSAAPAHVKLISVQWPASCFILGLILAGVCSWYVYQNYQANFKKALAVQQAEVNEKLQYQYATEPAREAAERARQEHLKEVAERAASTEKTYKRAHALGFASVFAFVMGCVCTALFVF
jgi:DNA topoisomerase IB